MTARANADEEVRARLLFEALTFPPPQPIGKALACRRQSH